MATASCSFFRVASHRTHVAVGAQAGEVLLHGYSRAAAGRPV